eukprot:PhM_4_TR11294/c0_g1_i1/m.93333
MDPRLASIFRAGLAENATSTETEQGAHQLGGLRDRVAMFLNQGQDAPLPAADSGFDPRLVVDEDADDGEEHVLGDIEMQLYLGVLEAHAQQQRRVCDDGDDDEEEGDSSSNDGEQQQQQQQLQHVPAGTAEARELMERLGMLNNNNNNNNVVIPSTRAQMEDNALNG